MRGRRDDAADPARSSVADLAEVRWGVRPAPAVARFEASGWSYKEQVAAVCPSCGGALHSMRKPYESGGRAYDFVALVCPSCPASFTLGDLGFSSYRKVLEPPRPTTRTTRTTSPPREAYRRQDGGGDGPTVAELVADRWGVRVDPELGRFRQPGWWHEGPSATPCPSCGQVLEAMRKHYTGSGARDGAPSYLVATVCVGCARTYTLQELKVRSFNQLMGASTASKRPARPERTSGTAERCGVADLVAPDCDVPPGSVRITPLRPGDVFRSLAECRDPSPSRVVAGHVGPSPAGDPASWPLWWQKVDRPDTRIPELGEGIDMRVILPDAPEFDQLCVELCQRSVPHHRIQRWVEAEVVRNVDERRRVSTLVAEARFAAGAGFDGIAARSADGRAALDAFQRIWDERAVPFDPTWTPVGVKTTGVPSDWVPLLPYSSLNPAQAEAAPHIVGGSEHLVVTAPTGAGKTMIGMIAVLEAIKGRGKKAAWLVPQRSLTEELDRELAAWREDGLRVERLSGDLAIDAARIQAADLWVATTEKFESICRTSSTSMRAALADVACLVVDEIHLLGDRTRGAVLEALLARVQGDDSPVRIVGLSATVANAVEVAEWLGARLVQTTWRPSRLTWQLPTIPAASEWKQVQANRTRLAVHLASRSAADGGSVLVFCGSKGNVRQTALAIAADRGAAVDGVSPDSADAVHRMCASVGVGLHYRDWEHRAEAEEAFRARRFDVLVATTTLAAGVNLPARTVIVRDTQVGLDEMGVATVQQMFGRAGRVGAGETEGWAYLIVDENERATWQERLVDGYTVVSQLAESVADHALAEIVRQRITNTVEAEEWWVRTFAHHQGNRELEPVLDALGFLEANGYTTRNLDDEDDRADRVAATELGALTARLMVPVVVATELRRELRALPVPANPDEAERALIGVLATAVPSLAEAPVRTDLRADIARRAHEQRTGRRAGSAAAPGLSPPASCVPGDLARVALDLVANHPQAFTRRGKNVDGLPRTMLVPLLEEAPRYLAWLAAQGLLGTVHPWIAVVASDLGRRVRWWKLGVPRGGGRLLWMCEQMATPAHVPELVPEMWRAARDRGVDSPDWTETRPPRRCVLDEADYVALLRDRTTDAQAQLAQDPMTAPAGATVVTWNRDGYELAFKPGRDRVLFTRRGDLHASGWLAMYNAIEPKGFERLFGISGGE